MDLTLVILAAGIGSRYGGNKQLDSFGPSGETIMDYSVYDAIRAGFKKVVFVIRHDFADAFRRDFVSKWDGKVQIDLAFQSLEDVPAGIEYNAGRTKPWGTAHAMLVAREVVNEPFAVINADDFYGAAAYQAIAGFLKEGHPEETGRYAMCGYLLANTLSKHGSVSRGVCKVDDIGNLFSVVENLKIYMGQDGNIYSEKAHDRVTLSSGEVVSMNFWGFTPDVFNYTELEFRDFLKKNADELKAEFLIPSLVDQLIRREIATVKVLKSDAVWFGVTYTDDKPATIQSIRRLVEEGKYPSNLWK